MTVTVVVPPSMSSDGLVHTYTDDSSPTTGLDGGGHVDRLVPLVLDTVSIANFAAQSAISVLGGATTNSTSSSSIVIGTGLKTFTLNESGKAYIAGQYVVAASTSTPSVNMIGQVTSFTGVTLVVNVTTVNGSGTITDWSISVTGSPQSTSVNADNITSGTLNDARLPTTLSPKTMVGLKLVKTSPSIVSGVVTLDLATANFFSIALTANITSFTLTNVPSGFFEFGIELIADGTARTVTWTFSSVSARWASGTAPTLTSTNTKRDTFVFYSHDSFANICAFKAGQNL